MSVKSLLKRITGRGDNGDDEDSPVYRPRTPMDETLPDGRSVDEAVAGIPTRQDARYPADPLGPTYSPAPQQPVDLAAQPGPVYSPPSPASAPTMADKYMATAVPMDTMTRPRVANPAAVAPQAQVTYATKKGQQVPVGATGGADDLENNQAYLAALEKYNPQNHNSRLASGGIEAGRAYLRGGGLVGAVTGLVRGLVQPNADEQYANEQNIAKAGRTVAQEQLNRKEASDRLNEQTKRDQEAAQIERTLHPIYEPKPTQADDGSYANITPGSDTAQPIYNPLPAGAAPGTARTPFKGKTPAEKATKKTAIFPGQDGRQEQWEVDDEGKKVKQIAVQTKDGLWVSPNSMYTGNALAGQRQATLARENKQDANRLEDKSQALIDKAQARKEKAGALTAKVDSGTAKWNFANKKMADLQGQIARESDAAKKEELKSGPGGLDYWENERAKSRDDVTGAAQELNNSYGDIYEAGPGTDIGYYKIKPWSEKAARAKFPHATQAQIDNAKAMAQAQGQPIIP